MVDRNARDRLIAAIEAYLADSISAFDFDERIGAIRTNDPVVRRLTHHLWYYYDDLKDHNVALSQAQWDYVQRLLLLLHSDAGVSVTTYRTWSWRQLIALLGFLVFLAGACAIGLRWPLFLLIFPLGILSFVITPNPEASVDIATTDKTSVLTPFETVSDMRAVHRTVPQFHKQRYPISLHIRRIRTPEAEKIFAVYCRVSNLMLQICFSPICLLFQTMPKTTKTTRVVPA